MTPETLTTELLDHRPEGRRRRNQPETRHETAALTPELLAKMNAYWRAANYVSVGQIYLYENPLLKNPETVAREAAGVGTGHGAGSKLHLRAPEPGHQEV